MAVSHTLENEPAALEIILFAQETMSKVDVARTASLSPPLKIDDFHRNRAFQESFLTPMELSLQVLG